jgi:cytochrome c5
LREHDRQFFDNFMLVLGILIGIGVGLFILARFVAEDTQDVYVHEDPAVQAAIDERIAPIGHVMLNGEEPAPSEAAPPAAAPAPVAATLSGPQVYNAACYLCHAPPGVGGAPPLGDGSAWGPRIAQGMEVLREHAFNGYQGKNGYMPPKGGRVDLSDEEIAGAIQFMVDQAQK